MLGTLLSWILERLRHFRLQIHAVVTLRAIEPRWSALPRSIATA